MPLGDRLDYLNALELVGQTIVARRLPPLARPPWFSRLVELAGRAWAATNVLCTPTPQELSHRLPLAHPADLPRRYEEDVASIDRASVLLDRRRAGLRAKALRQILVSAQNWGTQLPAWLAVVLGEANDGLPDPRWRDGGLRLVCPYTDRLQPETRAALALAARAGFAVEYRPVGDGADAYHQLLRRLWAEGDPVLLVEHDMEPTVATLRGLVDCPKPWCAARYVYGGHFADHALGCTKFTGELMRRHPTMLATVGVGFGTRWDWQDRWIAHALGARGYRPHTHFYPPVRHLGHVRLPGPARPG